MKLLLMFWNNCILIITKFTLEFLLESKTFLLKTNLEISDNAILMLLSKLRELLPRELLYFQNWEKNIIDVHNAVIWKAHYIIIILKIQFHFWECVLVAKTEVLIIWKRANVNIAIIKNGQYKKLQDLSLLEEFLDKKKSLSNLI